jgi:hypothetical protein
MGPVCGDTRHLLQTPTKACPSSEAHRTPSCNAGTAGTVCCMLRLLNTRGLLNTRFLSQPRHAPFTLQGGGEHNMRGSSMRPWLFPAALPGTVPGCTCIAPCLSYGTTPSPISETVSNQVECLCSGATHGSPNSGVHAAERHTLQQALHMCHHHMLQCVMLSPQRWRPPSLAALQGLALKVHGVPGTVLAAEQRVWAGRRKSVCQTSGCCRVLQEEEGRTGDGMQTDPVLPRAQSRQNA